MKESFRINRLSTDGIVYVDTNSFVYWEKEKLVAKTFNPQVIHYTETKEDFISNIETNIKKRYGNRFYAVWDKITIDEKRKKAEIGIIELKEIHKELVGILSKEFNDIMLGIFKSKGFEINKDTEDINITEVV